MSWTAERLAQLAELIAAGHSAQAIAGMLGITRNSVIGKAARSGIAWPARPMPIRVVPAAQAAWQRDMPRFLALIEVGASARSVADALGRPVDQVRDKAQRMGLRFGHRGRFGGYALPKADRPRAEPVPPPAPQPAANGQPVHFLDRRAGSCVWPLWQPPARIGMCCGAATAKPGEPYCAEHRAAAWIGTRYARTVGRQLVQMGGEEGDE